MRVLEQQRTDQSPIDQNWRRPATICVSLALLGALLGGAIWLQSAPPAAQPKVHAYPLMPTVPLTIGFYDLSNRKVLPKDPVLQRFAALHLDYLILQGVGAHSGNEAARIAGMTGADVKVASESFGRDYYEGLYAVDLIIARHPLTDVQLLSIAGKPYGIWAESQIGDRVIYLASASGGPEPRKSGFDDLQQRWQGLAIVPNPQPPMVVGFGDSAHGDMSGLLQLGTGWFDAAAAFWNSAAAPPPGHLFFSSGWSCTGGKVISDPSDPQHRRGYVVTTAGAAPPATNPAGKGDE